MQMNKDYIEKFDVIRRYHQNKLNDNELSSFEVYILENPEIINVIEKEKIIHDAFKEHEPLLKEKPKAGAGNTWTRGLAMAACLVVAVVVVFSYSGNEATFTQQPPVILETFRGAGDNAVQLSGEPVVLFQVDMGPAELLDANAFTAELVDTQGNITFRMTNMGVDADGWLYYDLEGQDTDLAGNYQVRIYPDNQPAQATSYPVRFTAP